MVKGSGILLGNLEPTWQTGTGLDFRWFLLGAAPVLEEEEPRGGEEEEEEYTQVQGAAPFFWAESAIRGRPYSSFNWLNFLSVPALQR